MSGHFLVWPVTRPIACAPYSLGEVNNLEKFGPASEWHTVVLTRFARQASNRWMAGDSRVQRGGRIPGLEGEPAFVLRAPAASALPVLIAVPHAGQAYPDAITARLRDAQQTGLRLEDRHADLVGDGLARATGAALIVARAPRAMIDLNRAETDIDWTMFGRKAGSQVSVRVRGGLGLIPNRVPGIGAIWRKLHDVSELDARLAAIHVPYHAAITAELERLRARWGAALLIDLHSMPPLGEGGARIVLGDRFGAACHGRLAATAFACLARMRLLAGHNRPYAGGYALDRHAAPAHGIHAMQIEIDRSLYLDAALDRPGAGLAGLVKVMAALVRDLGRETAAIGRKNPPAPDWPLAAE